MFSFHLEGNLQGTSRLNVKCTNEVLCISIRLPDVSQRVVPYDTHRLIQLSEGCFIKASTSVGWVGIG